MSTYILQWFVFVRFMFWCNMFWNICRQVGDFDPSTLLFIFKVSSISYCKYPLSFFSDIFLVSHFFVSLKRLIFTCLCYMLFCLCKANPNLWSSIASWDLATIPFHPKWNLFGQYLVYREWQTSSWPVRLKSVKCSRSFNRVFPWKLFQGQCVVVPFAQLLYIPASSTYAYSLYGKLCWPIFLEAAQNVCYMLHNTARNEWW